MTFEVPSRFLSAFIKMADASRHIDTTAEHVAAMLNSPTCGCCDRAMARS
jgi:hypothetical protein